MNLLQRFKFRMLPKLYVQMTGMILLSTGTVLVCILGADWAVTAQWRQYNVSMLEGERQEVQSLLKEYLAHPGPAREEPLLDDTGQQISYAVFDRNQLVVQSNVPQLPADVLRTCLSGPKIQDFTYQDQPFRLYHDTWTYDGATYAVVIYQMIARERQMMDQARDVLVAAGVAGAVVAAVFNVKLARIALASLHKNWETQREWLLELSHELQTPLAVARAALSAKAAAAERKLAVQAIDDASSLVRDIVYLTKLSTLPETTPPEPVPVSEVTEEAVQRLAPLAHYRNIRLAGAAQPGLFVSTTAERWFRLVSLVVKNGIDHGAKDSTVSWNLYQAGGYVILEVQNRPSAGRPTEASVKRGVGLMIVERLVKELRGSFSIFAHEVQTTARVTVPALRPKSG